MTNVTALGQFMASPDDKIAEKIGSFVGNTGIYNAFGSGNIQGSSFAGPITFGNSADVELGSDRHNTEGYSKKTSMLAESLKGEGADFENFHNFDVVMSHTMSQEDYAKAREDGFDMKDLDPSEAVTILDKVKTVLASSEQIIEGFNDDLDATTLKNITGSEVMAGEILDSFHQNDIPITKENIEDVLKAVEKGSDLIKPKDMTAYYLIENKLEPSIDNFYLAEHATSGRRSGQGSYYVEGGYLNKIGEDSSYDDLATSISEVIQEAGYDADDENMQDTARKLLKDGLALTPDNLLRIVQIDSLSFPLSKEQIIESATAAIADGKKGTMGSLLENESLVKKAVSLKKSLFLEETRFEMSAEVNLRLLRSGIRIDTSYVEKAVEDLKAANEQIAKVLFPERDDATQLYELYKKTNDEVCEIKESPAAVVGALIKEFKSATLEDIFNKASRLKVSCEKAQIAYESVGTQVRSDLGDNIKKAFRNVDELLNNMDMEANDDNRRAIRILAYNHAEVTRQSVELVKSWDSKLVSTLDKLKGAAVLDMIREGRNPLSMTLDELGGYLDEKDSEHEGQSEKYSRFLYKLEKSGQISDKEKESYIGIFRLFENLKATDHAAIGMVLSTGSEMTIGNLLTANRTIGRSKKGMDFIVDDNFGGLQGQIRSSKAIDVQIETAFRYYSGKADSAYENISPEKMAAFEKAGNAIEDTLLPEFAKVMEEEGDKSLEKELNLRELEDIRNTLSDNLAKESSQELERAGIRVTAGNLEAMEDIIASRQRRNIDSIWNRLREKIKDKEKNLFEDVLDIEDTDIDEKLDDLKELDKYKNTINDLKEGIETAINKTDTYIDIKALKLLHKDLAIAGAMADKGSYEIPIDTGSGEVSLHLSFRTREDEAPRIEASIETENYGTIRADLSFSGEKDIENKAPDFSGMITTSKRDNAEVRHFMESIKFKMTGDVKADNLVIMYEVTKQANINTQTAVSREADTTDKSLVKTAELFIQAVTGSLMDQG